MRGVADLEAFAVRQLHDVVVQGVRFAPFLAVRGWFSVQGIPDAQVTAGKRMHGEVSGQPQE